MNVKPAPIPASTGRLMMVLLVTASACTTMVDVEPLGVTLVDLEVRNVTVFETTLVAKLRITNPNPEPISIDGASFKLYLDDKKVGVGTTAEVFTVERLDSFVVDTVFHLNNASAIMRLRDVLRDNEVGYGIRGSLFTQGPFGTRKIRVEKHGSVDLDGRSSAETDEAVREPGQTLAVGIHSERP
jgi:LEA14-like dessication related protein